MYVLRMPSTHGNQERVISTMPGDFIAGNTVIYKKINESLEYKISIGLVRISQSVPLGLKTKSRRPLMHYKQKLIKKSTWDSHAGAQGS